MASVRPVVGDDADTDSLVSAGEAVCWAGSRWALPHIHLICKASHLGPFREDYCNLELSGKTPLLNNRLNKNVEGVWSRLRN